MKIVSVVGARPQFIKAAAISRATREINMAKGSPRIDECLLHTGQHFDDNMSKVFFDELEIPSPHYNLGISGGSHGAMTGRMLEAIEQTLLKEHPDCVVVYGDTNTALAGALAAVKLSIPVGHVEAGLRSFNMRMPEEVNRVITDNVSTLLFCPTDAAIKNLKSQGITSGVHKVGDVIYDAALFYRERAQRRSRILTELGLAKKAYVLVTFHRAENTDDRFRLEEIVDGLSAIAEHVPVVLPLHPRTRKRIRDEGLTDRLANVNVIEPVGFLDMICLEYSAQVIATDSGGVQKEAYFYDVPCITMRDETEWVETVEQGANMLTGTDRHAIKSAYLQLCAKSTGHAPWPRLFGDGRAADYIVNHLAELADIYA